MPRSERHQQSIDRHRQSYKARPGPKHGEKAPVSWWLGLDRDAMSAQAAKEQRRMAPNAGISGDKGVIY